MRPISEDTWAAAFRSRNGRYDGRRFEELASRLLERLHGPGWKPTAASHDGSRDFEKREGNQLLWAECKAYSQRVSIYVLSPTLVMALLDEADIVIVLSRSMLNRNAIWHLARYKHISDKEIYCYDGPTLDRAIISAGLFSAFFPGHSVSSHGSNEIELSSSVTTDVFSSPIPVDFDSPYATKMDTLRAVTTRALIRVDLLVRNLASHTTIPMEVAVTSAISSHFRILSFCGESERRSQSYQLKGGSFVRVELFVQATRQAARVQLPQVNVSYGSGHTKTVDSGHVKISHLYQTPIIGEQAREFLTRAVQALGERRMVLVISVEGASGSGKTRMLQEIMIKGVEAGYSCYRYDPEFEDARASLTTLRGLVSDLCELPVIDVDLKADDFNHGFLSDPNGVLVRLLYDPGFNAWAEVDGIVSALLGHLKARKILLAFDNVQFMDEKFVGFLERLLFQAHALPGVRLAVNVIFNTDFERKQSPVRLFRKRLRAHSSDIARQQSHLHCQLKDFTREDVAEFVGYALTPPRTRVTQVRLYRHTLDLLLEWVQPRPLNLWQSLMYLADEGVLCLDAGRLKVNEEHTLLFRVQRLPAGLWDLLELRWQRLRKIAQEESPYAPAVTSTLRAVYFLGADYPDHLIQLGGSHDGIAACEEMGWLARDHLGRIRFFHSQIFLFFRGKFAVVDQNTAMGLRQSLKDADLVSSKFQQYFILSHQACLVTPALLRATVQHMDQRGLTPEYWEQYTDFLTGYLMDGRRSVGPVVLKGVKLVTEWQQKLRSLTSGASLAKSFLSHRLVHADRSRQSGRYLLEFHFTAINALLAVFDDFGAHEVIELALADIERAQFQDDKDREEWKARILNRRAATLKNFARFDEAIEAVRSALSICRRWKNWSMEVENLFDLAEVYRRSLRRRDAALKCLHEGLLVFEAHEEEMVAPAPCRYHFVRGLVAFDESRFSDGLNSLRTGVMHCRRVRNHFWEVRTLCLEIAARLLWSSRSKSELQQIEDVLTDAQDLVNITQAKRSAWMLNYLSAELFICRKDLRSATDQMERAITEFITHLRTPDQVASRREILVDMATTWRRYSLEIDRKILTPLQNDALRREMELILSTRKEDLHVLEQRRLEQALLRHNGRYINIF